ncbi:MAG: hypothetical protein GYA87_07515 [Christensenellaceae bacterium]|nr:hypothetical protein [Christensenellaceae bacterium]
MKKICLLFFVLLFLFKPLALAKETYEFLDVQEIVPYTITTQANNKLLSGTKNILQLGKNGINKVTYKLTLKDGLEISRQKLYIEVLEKMIPQIEEYGTATSSTYNIDNNKKELFYATLNQKMATRTGPSTRYTEPGTYPKDTEIRIIEKELDDNNVPWGLVEFSYRKVKFRAYTGMKRIDCDADLVPWGNSLNEITYTLKNSSFYYGPGTEYAKHKYDIAAGSSIILIDYENGYAMIDFHNGTQWVRGYILEENVAD